MQRETPHAYTRKQAFPKDQRIDSRSAPTLPWTRLAAKASNKCRYWLQWSLQKPAAHQKDASTSIHLRHHILALPGRDSFRQSNEIFPISTRQSNEIFQTSTQGLDNKRNCTIQTIHPDIHRTRQTLGFTRLRQH